MDRQKVDVATCGTRRDDSGRELYCILPVAHAGSCITGSGEAFWASIDRRMDEWVQDLIEANRTLQRRIGRLEAVYQAAERVVRLQSAGYDLGGGIGAMNLLRDAVKDAQPEMCGWVNPETNRPCTRAPHTDGAHWCDPLGRPAPEPWPKSKPGRPQGFPQDWIDRSHRREQG